MFVFCLLIQALDAGINKCYVCFLIADGTETVQVIPLKRTLVSSP